MMVKVSLKKHRLMHVVLLTQDGKSAAHLGYNVIYDIADPLLQLPKARFEVSVVPHRISTSEQLRCLLYHETNRILELSIRSLRQDFSSHSLFVLPFLRVIRQHSRIERLLQTTTPRLLLRILGRYEATSSTCFPSVISSGRDTRQLQSTRMKTR